MELLLAACAETEPASLDELSIGERDTRLLRLRELTFGPRLAGVTDCPNCDGRLELEFDVGQMNAIQPSSAPRFLEHSGYEIEFRLPNSHDLRAARAVSDAAYARVILFERCTKCPLPLDEAPAEVIEAVASAMSLADPQGDLRIALECPICRCSWEEIFDIASFLWHEVRALAMRIAYEVHQLASAYGWSEVDIVAMSSRRRQIYLEMLAE
ncbi:hypothetical protein JAO29_09175 [Edaphobacter sp. HDX4]